jgi:hypothetical protein
MPSFYLWSVWICLIAFACRVSAQVFVGVYAPPWLPPFDEWYWGFIPYPVVFLFELTLLMAMTLTAYDCTRASGLFFDALQQGNAVLRWVLLLWFVGNTVRYILTMALHPDHRWLKGTIPIACNYLLILFFYSCLCHVESLPPLT